MATSAGKTDIYQIGLRKKGGILWPSLQGSTQHKNVFLLLARGIISSSKTMKPWYFLENMLRTNSRKLVNLES